MLSYCRQAFLRLAFSCITLACVSSSDARLHAEDSFHVTLRYQTPTSEASPRYHQLTRDEAWSPSKTAIIVCDMWDSHHCYNAVQREKEFAPRLNELLVVARERGAFIIHAPSGCMDAYAEHPARLRAIQSPVADDHPENIATWCYKIPSEEAAEYPIDQSDGGEDDTPEEKAAWEIQLRAEGRNVKQPWRKQIEDIKIDDSRDYISDQGKEIWNVLREHGIQHVILTGVHTNMCVLGRPFGLRRLATAGLNVALLRDFTDTMYNPRAKPFVSHFSGTDLIIDHIERHVCPTMTSDQFLGGKPFRFQHDTRPHVAILISEPEYETERTLPVFAEKLLRRDYRLTMVFGSETEPNSLPGIEAIADADALLVSVRRRTPPPSELSVVRDFVAQGKAVVGIRTANHAFSLRTGEIPENASDWKSWDAEVFGGSYSNHYGNDLLPQITWQAEQSDHPILVGVAPNGFTAGGSLYVVAPVHPTATLLMSGVVPGHLPEPVAWTFTRADSGVSFYTSLGARKDFENPAFEKLLSQAVQWCVSQTNTESTK